MKKTLKILLLAVMMMMGGSTLAATTVKWLASSGNSLSSPIAVDDYITLTWSEANGEQAPKYSGSSVYFFNGNQVKLSAIGDATINKITFTFSQDKNSMQILSGGGTISQGIWTGESTEVSFRAARQTGVRYISAIEVTYTLPGDTPVEQVADMSITNATINSTAALDADAYPSVFVNYTNTGNVAAQNAKVTLYVGGVANKVSDLGTVNVGTTAFTTLYYDKSAIEAGDHEVYVTITADNDKTDGEGTKQTSPVTVTFTKEAPKATFTVTANDVEVAYDATEATISALVTNTSTVEAASVPVVLVKGMTTIESKTINLAAGAETTVTFTINGPFEAGSETTYQVQVNNNQAGVNVTLKVGEAPIVASIDMELVQFMTLSEINLKETNTVSVWYKNNSNVAVETATVTLKVGGTVVETKTLENIAMNATGSVNFTVPTTGLTAGTKATLEATVTAEGDNNADNNTITREYDVVSGEPTEATFAVTAEDVTVAYDATSYTVTAQVENTSTVDATGVVVQLLSGTTVMAETTVDVAAGQTTEAQLTVNGGPFEAGKQEMQVIVANKYGKWVNITVEEAPVVPVFDLAIVEVMGTIQLGAETNSVRVTVQNNGNQDITDAALSVKFGNTELGTGTVSAKAGQTGWCMVSVNTDGLTAGEALLTATVSVENHATPDDNTMQGTVTVEAAVVELTFEVAASDVTVAYDATTYTVTAQVKNTSTADAEDVTVQLLSGTTVLAETTVDVKAGQTAEATLTVEGGPFEAGKQEMQIVVAGKYGKWINVTVEEEPVQQVVNLAVTSINGTLYQDVERNFITVFVDNLGTADVTDATVTITAGTTVLGTATVSVKAGNNAFCSVPVDASSLSTGDIEIVAKVEAEGDVDTTDNELSKTINVTLATGITAVKALPADAQVYTIDGKKATNVRRGRLYIVRSAEGRLQRKKMLLK